MLLLSCPSKRFHVRSSAGAWNCRCISLDIGWSISYGRTHETCVSLTKGPVYQCGPCISASKLYNFCHNFTILQVTGCEGLKCGSESMRRHIYVTLNFSHSCSINYAILCGLSIALIYTHLYLAIGLLLFSSVYIP